MVSICQSSAALLTALRRRQLSRAANRGAFERIARRGPTDVDARASSSATKNRSLRAADRPPIAASVRPPAPGRLARFGGWSGPRGCMVAHLLWLRAWWVGRAGSNRLTSVGLRNRVNITLAIYQPERQPRVSRKWEGRIEQSVAFVCLSLDPSVSVCSFPSLLD